MLTSYVCHLKLSGSQRIVRKREKTVFDGLNMSRTNALSIGGDFQMLACNSETVESFIAVVSSVSQCEEDSKIGVAICSDPEGLCCSADGVLDNLLGVRCLVGDSRI